VSARKASGSRKARAIAPDSGAALAFDTLSIREVAQRHGQLKAMLERGANEIDLGALTSVDTAGLQLLLAAAHAAQARGMRLRLRGAQPLLSDATRILGMDAQLSALAQILP
jgi:anti-anti-sigma regulatory factor